MNRLLAELRRLYLLDDVIAGTATADANPATLPLVDADGSTRTLVIAFRQAEDWVQVARLWQGVQQDLGLPAPAISVSGGNAAYRLWFSLASAVPLQQACAVLERLRSRYLGEMPAERYALRPGLAADAQHVPWTPARDADSGRWSAFIDPGMGGLFVEEPWLELAPNPDRQADLLAGVDVIDAADFRRLLDLPATTPCADAAAPYYSDPRQFLLAIMNDPGAALALRIEAARALLPGVDAGR